MSKTLDYIALIVVFIGAVNWGLTDCSGWIWFG